MIELPKDAEGREIPLDTVCMYDRNGNSIGVIYWCFTTRIEPIYSEKNIWIVVDEERHIKDPALLYLTPPDSWEKLEEDLDRCIEESNLCMYYNQNLDCNNCAISGNETRGCTSIALEDIKKRIRKLRGVS